MDWKELNKKLGTQAFEQWMCTDNGDEIKPDLMVFTYDWKWGKVDRDDFEDRMARNADMVNRGFDLNTNDFWFNVNYSDHTTEHRNQGLYNGMRMTTTCPNCRGDFEACDRSGCGQRKSPNWTGWNVK